MIEKDMVFGHDPIGTDVYGFWLYILTDCVLFGSLFATFIVLNYPGAFGPALKDYINLSFVLVETFFLLASNFTFGLAMLAMYRKNIGLTQFWLAGTFVLGACFVGLELWEFRHLIHEGYHWQVSGAASAFFTLVATHGLHVSAGLVWIIMMILQFKTFGQVPKVEKNMVMLGIFWNFLDVVWIFVFTTVYLTGAL